jgi:hypothetical protein
LLPTARQTRLTQLVGELESTAFEVDNTSSRVQVTSVRVDRGRTLVTFDVTDDHSPIQRVEFSQDGQQWRGAFPADGLADSRSEHYSWRLQASSASRGLSMRATDSMNTLARCMSTSQQHGRPQQTRRALG